MDTRQFTGRSAAEAAIKACEALGVTRSALRYDIVSDAGEGLDRRVTIAVDGAVAVASVEQEAPSRESGAESGRSERSYGHSQGTRREGGGRERSNSRDTRRRDFSEGPSRPRRDRDGYHGRSERPAQSDEGIDALLSLDPAAPSESLVVRDEWTGPVSAKADRAKATLVEMFRLMGLLDLAVRLIRDEEGEIQIDITGSSEAKIIGNKGDVLLSLQFLLNRMVGRDEENDTVIVLDAGGYRERRRHALATLAKRLADRAVAEGKAVRLTPMSSHDRRVFHMTLKDMPGVSTRSEGEGFYKQLYIIPS